MTQDKFLEFLARKEREMEAAERKRPGMLAKSTPYYDTDASKYPEMIRVSFDDGSTIIYETKIQQPAPVITENIRIIHEMKIGYQAATGNEYRPRRRDRR